jgi:hypothetical protein
MTQSHCPVVVFFLMLLTYFSKFSFTSHQPISAADFGWRGNHVKLVDIIMSTKSAFIKFQFLGGLGGLQPGCALGTCMKPTPSLASFKIRVRIKLSQNVLRTHCYACIWDCRSSGMLHRVDVSGQSVGPIFKGQAGHFLDCLTLEDRTDTLSRNVGNYQSKLRNTPEERRFQLTVRWIIIILSAHPT